VGVNGVTFSNIELMTAVHAAVAKQKMRKQGSNPIPMTFGSREGSLRVLPFLTPPGGGSSGVNYERNNPKITQQIRFVMTRAKPKRHGDVPRNNRKKKQPMEKLILITTLVFAALLIYAAPLHAGPKPKTMPTAQERLPVAVPVPGKPGLVYSPYAKGKIMDVEPFKHGEVVLCPYTARKFRVP
jgi:hypothetical protein